MIIGINGKAGVGKSTVADFLVRDFSFVCVALADPLKRIVKDVFDMSDEQLWGPSEKRNEPDKRYERPLDPLHEKIVLGLGLPREYIFPDQYLTPRLALQLLGTEWGRACYPNIWVEYALRVADKLLDPTGSSQPLYNVQEGLHYAAPGPWDPYRVPMGIVIPDVRFQNEIDGLRSAGAKLIRVKRPGAGLQGDAAQHKSETEQDGIPDSVFDVVIENDGTLEELALKIRSAMGQFNNPFGAEHYQPTQDEIQEACEAAGVPGTATHEFYQRIKSAQLESNDLNDLEGGLNLQCLHGAVQTDPHIMKKLLEQRAADVKAGKILDYDEAQKDVPPMLRKQEPMSPVMKDLIKVDEEINSCMEQILFCKVLAPEKRVTATHRIHRVLLLLEQSRAALVDRLPAEEKPGS